MSADLIKVIVFFALIGFLFWRNLPGALIFVRPGLIRCRMAGGVDAMAPISRGPAMREMIDEIEELGFAPLGVLTEQRPLARTRRELVYASADART